MSSNPTDLLQRAERVLTAAKFGVVACSTVMEYRRLSDRICVKRQAAGTSWAGPTAGVESCNSSAVRRAAWCRRTHVEVATAIRDLRERRVAVDAAIGRLETWLPEAERYPPLPRRDISALRGRRPSAPRPVKSKRGGLRELPPTWMQQIRSAAVDADGHRHLDAIAVLLATGCRPAEAVWGVDIRRFGDGVEITITGAKVREGAGQPWRKLTVANDVDGPAAHLLQLADSAGGAAYVRTHATPPRSPWQSPR